MLYPIELVALLIDILTLAGHAVNPATDDLADQQLTRAGPA